MKKVNQKGIAHLVAILVLVVLVAIGGVGYYVYNRSQHQSSKQEFVQESNNSTVQDRDLITFKDVHDVDTSGLSPNQQDKLKYAKRYRFVKVSEDAWSSVLDKTTVKIELFDDVILVMDSQGPPVPGASGSTTWSGSKDGDYATLTFLNNKTIGTFFHDRVSYEISPASGSTHLILVDGRKLPRCDEGCEG